MNVPLFSATLSSEVKEINMTNDTDVADIMAAVKIYFDGLYDSNTDMLAHVFHPDCRIIGYGSDGKMVIMTADHFFKFVATVPSPKAEGVPFDMSILGIERTGKVASVRVHDFYLGRDFIDHLHLVETDGGWLITSKMFHSEARD